MRSRLDEIARSCGTRGKAVGAFTCYDLATAHAVVRAAIDLSEPVVLLVSPATAASRYGSDLVAGVRAVADRAPIPVSVQLDHARDLDVVRRTVKAGADAVLIDGSHLGLADNIEFVRAAKAALGADVVVEAELGRINGNEDVALSTGSGTEGLTDPDEARMYVEATGADLLAVSVGNVHGRYAGEPSIDQPRLAAIAQRVHVPLVMHGASGLSSEVLRECVGNGISKVNVNTELRQQLLNYLDTAVPAALGAGLNLDRLFAGWTADVRDMARNCILGLAGSDSRRGME